MSVYAGPEISEDGLVLCLDAANSKSYNPNLVTTLGAFDYTFNGQLTSTGLDVAPDGTTVLCKHDLTGATGPFMNVRVDRTIVPGTYTISAWVKGTTSFSGAFAFVGETTSEIPYTTINVTQTWQRVSYTFNLTATQNNSRIQIFFSTQGNDKIISVWGVEIVKGSASTPNYIISDNRGDTWYDLSGSVNNATLVGGVGYSSDNKGSTSFDGVDDYINGVHNSQLDLTGDVTVECWFKVTNTRSDWVRIFGKGDSTNRTFGLWYNQSSDAFLYQRYGTSYMNISYGAAVSLNTWYHMVGTSSGSNHTLYLNNEVKGTSTTGTTFYSSTASYTVGYHGSIHTYHIGNVSNCRIYNRALTAAEVQQNFQALRGRFGI